MKKILIIGSLNLDLVLSVDHSPVTGETVLCDKVEFVPVRKGANQAYAAGRLGADAAMLGMVGDDSYGEKLLASLGSAGVDVSHIIRAEGVPTGIAVITVSSNGDNSIVVASGANACLSREDIDRNKDLIENSDIILLQMEIPIDTVFYAAKTAKEMGKTVILDPAPVPAHFPEELYQYIDIIKPNETELSMLTGICLSEKNIEVAAGCIRNKGVKDVLVTLGEHGVYLDSEQFGILKIPAIKVSAVDTTAAGDTFTAAVAVMLAQEKNIYNATIFANYVAAVVVTRKGAQSSIPALEEIKTWMI